jgi:hypothetical protein
MSYRSETIAAVMPDAEDEAYYHFSFFEYAPNLLQEKNPQNYKQFREARRSERRLLTPHE